MAIFVASTKSISEQAAKNLVADEPKRAKSLFGKKDFMLNTNYNNSKSAYMNRLENHEAAAFHKGWREISPI